MFLDRLDPKMSGCSSPPEARLSNNEQAVCQPDCREIPVCSARTRPGSLPVVRLFCWNPGA